MSLKGTPGISNGYSTENRSFLSWSVLSPGELSRFVHLLVSGLTFISRNVKFGNWSLQVCFLFLFIYLFTNLWHTKTEAKG